MLLLFFFLGKEYTLQVSEPDLDASMEAEEENEDETMTPSQEEEVVIVEEPVVKMKELKQGGVRGVRIRAAPSLSVSHHTLNSATQTIF